MEMKHKLKTIEEKIEGKLKTKPELQIELTFEITNENEYYRKSSMGLTYLFSRSRLAWQRVCCSTNNSNQSINLSIK